MAVTPEQFLAAQQGQMPPVQQVPMGDPSMAGALGVQPQAPDPAAYAGIIQPTPDILQNIARPAASPEEHASRVEGWKQVADNIFSNPNLMRAMGFAGAYMAQPRQFGQTLLGQVGGAFTVGQTAYDAGKTSQEASDLALSEEARKKALNESTIAGQTSRTEGQNLENERSRLTQDAVVAQAKATSEKALLDLSKAQNDEKTFGALERELKGKIAKINAEIPEGDRRKAALAELEKPIVEIARLRAQITASEAAAGASGAAARASNVKADHDRITVDMLKEMKAKTPEDFKEFMTKTGKFAPSHSAIAAQKVTYDKMYDELPADSPSKKGVTKAQYTEKRMTEAKQADAATLYIKWLAADGTPGDPMGEMLKAQALGSLGSRPGASGSFAPATTPAGVQPGGKYVRDANGKLVLQK